ncbi:MAG: hypothetical protein BWY82_01809 [Verrucomicrobia bacterium ADurb.Bin474]|nr:MAG: hypothetical protein BWY82_01809 [Verrucomicrobia bacterium ADurb.Bin474]
MVRQRVEQQVGVVVVNCTEDGLVGEEAEYCSGEGEVAEIPEERCEVDQWLNEDDVPHPDAGYQKIEGE